MGYFVRIPAALFVYEASSFLEGKRGFKRTKNPVESCNKAGKTSFQTVIWPQLI
jgi:hypothetical protein